ncbi:MAG: hypothetical protein H6581_24715 [Bacteroidia bacterium]|nr:hypothetical protein [Bacteroidia bacterium]
MEFPYKTEYQLGLEFPPETSEAQKQDLNEEVRSVLIHRLDVMGFPVEFDQKQNSPSEITFTVRHNFPPNDLNLVVTSPGKLEFRETVPYRDGIRELEMVNDVVRILKSEAGENEQLEFFDDTTQTQETRRSNFVKRYPLFEHFQNISDEQFQEYPGTPLLGYVSIRDTQEFNYWLNHPEVIGIRSEKIDFAWSDRCPVKGEFYLELIGIFNNPYHDEILGNKEVEEAVAEFRKDSEDARISIKMNVEGSHLWEEITHRNINQSIAILVDGYVISYPRVNMTIKGGNSEISGDFQPDEARRIAALISNPAFPIRVIIQKRTEK